MAVRVELVDPPDQSNSTKSISSRLVHPAIQNPTSPIHVNNYGKPRSHPRRGSGSPHELLGQISHPYTGDGFHLMETVSMAIPGEKFEVVDGILNCSAFPCRLIIIAALGTSRNAY
ncbi:hypothetical protein SAY87_003398 [Trapa incisa]|uniref:Uncharacterized protein n=1 Tax=Trapa incisa TaxID=236973 RepID=A0AAN7QHN4_9MYRT|nr:hypothetical protein SAY87_003398 [Trapa incisa]